MNSEITYLLKANIILVIFYLFYWLFLKRETFYEWNRYYFLLTILLAFVFPLVDFSSLFTSYQTLTIEKIAPVFPLNVSGKENGFTLTEGILLVIAIGAGVLVSRLGMQLVSLWEIRSKSTPGDSCNGYQIRNLHTVTNPFSFFHTIYLNPELHNEEDRHTILMHESIHVQQKHSYDVILFELACALCWYNPVIWLIRQAGKQNIEFYTDKQVLKAGYDKRHYQHELLKVSQIPSFLGIANNFNFNHLKQRIMMMNKKQSGHAKLFKFALIIPVLACVAFISNAQDVLSKKEATSTATTANKIAGISVDKEVHDFGTVKESNGKISAVFTITNTSKDPMVIENVTASCGCTTPEWTKEPIAPGKQGHVKATYDPTNRPGPFDKTITVKTQKSTSALLFHIKGTVVQE